MTYHTRATTALAWFDGGFWVADSEDGIVGRLDGARVEPVIKPKRRVGWDHLIHLEVGDSLLVTSPGELLEIKEGGAVRTIGKTGRLARVAGDADVAWADKLT